MKINSICKPFIERKPWAALLIGLLDPIAGYLYLNRGLAALSLTGFIITYFGSVFVLAYYQLITFPPYSVVYLGLFIRTIAAISCFFIAKMAIIGKPKWYAHWYSIILITLALMLAALLFRTFFYEPFDARSASMSPTINKSDDFFVDKRAYNSTNLPARGDIVLFAPQTNPSVRYIKRIIGMPNDHIEFKDCVIYINNTPLTTSQIENIVVDGKEMARFTETLPEGKKINIIKEKNSSNCDFHYSYDVPSEQYFVMGDNRDNSDDSRYKIGYIPEKSILGKTSFIYLNGKTHQIIYKHVD